jgi:hypothetical protein
MPTTSPAPSRSARTAVPWPWSPGGTERFREERVSAARPDRVRVPEAGEADVDVVMAEVPARPDVDVLDLEAAHRDE